jgi:hypothetical protein
VRNIGIYIQVLLFTLCLYCFADEGKDKTFDVNIWYSAKNCFSMDGLSFNALTAMIKPTSVEYKTLSMSKASFDGMDALFGKSGKIYWVRIYKDNYHLFGGIKVGVPYSSVLEVFKNGFWTHSQDIKYKNDAYFVLNFIKKDVSGIGFCFYFDEYKILRQIEYGTYSFEK